MNAQSVQSLSASAALNNDTACRPLLTVGLVPGRCDLVASAVLDAAFEAPLRSDCLREWLASGGQDGGFPASAIPAAGSWGVLDSRLLDALDALASRLPDARYLVFVDSPISVISSGQVGSSAAERLDMWQASAGRALALIRRRRRHCLVVNLEEALADPGGLVAMIEGHVGLTPRATPKLPAFDTPTSSEDLLAYTLLRGRPMASALYEELLACCQPLGGKKVDEPGFMARRDPARDAQTAAAIIDRLRSLDMKAEQSQRETLKAETTENAEKEEKADLTRRLEALGVELKTAQQDGEESRQEAELLLIQLHQVQEELEHYYLAWREADERPPARYDDDISVGKLTVSTERRTSPHRELALIAEDIRIGTQHRDTLSVRLIEHNGRSGLAVIADSAVAPPLSGWVEHGREGERPFMLVIPSDSSFDAVWRRLPRSDWQLLTALPAHIEGLLTQRDDLMPRWRQICRQLACQFNELPVRLRYDGIEAIETDAGLSVTFSRLLFGPRVLDEVVLRWQPEQRSLWVRHCERDGLTSPLTTWPQDDNGEPLEEWRLPISGADRAGRLRAWDRVSLGDRELLLALLDALPAIADRLPGRVDLRRQAAELLQSALTDLSGGRLRRVAQRLLQPKRGIRA